jgi:hypothetical protein
MSAAVSSIEHPVVSRVNLTGGPDCLHVPYLPWFSFSARITFTGTKVLLRNRIVADAEAQHPVDIASWSPLDVELVAIVKIRDENASLLQDFFSEEKVAVHVETMTDIDARLWGFIPWRISGFQCGRTLLVDGLNMQRQIDANVNVSAITNTTPLSPSVLRVDGAAYWHNPSMLTMTLATRVRLDLHYQSKYGVHPVGYLLFGNESAFTIHPGPNLVVASGALVQTPTNGPGLRAMVADFLGTPRGFEKSGLNPMRIFVQAPAWEAASRQDGADATFLTPQNDARVAACLRGLNLSVVLRPPEMMFLQYAQLDAHIVSFSPRRYEVKLIVYLDFPIDAIIRSATMTAFYPDLTGELVYTFQHPFDQVYALHGRGNNTVGVPLMLSEITIPSIDNIVRLAKEVMHGMSSVGILLRLDIAVGPFEIKIDYRNFKVPARIIIHPIGTRRSHAHLQLT